MRATLSLAATALLLTTLTGCFKVDMDLDVHADDTVDGTIIAALDAQLAAMAEEDESESLLDDLPEGAEVEEYDEDGLVGEKVTFTDVPLEEFADLSSGGEPDSDPFTLTRDGDEFVFEGTVDAQEMAGGDMAGDAPADDEFAQGMTEMMERAFADAEFRVSITFPGEIRETNGDVDGTTVTWDLDLTEDSRMHAVAADSSGLLGVGLIPLAIGGAVLLALLGGAGWWWARRRAAA